MATSLPSREEFEALRARLEETEETLFAIRTGQVDALVVHGKSGEQVFTLRGAEEPYRILVERMQEGALTIGRDGTILYSNKGFAELLGVGMERVVGARLSDFVEADDAASLDETLLHVGPGGARREVSLARADGRRLPALVSLSPMPIDGVEGLSAIVTDISESKRAEEMAVAERFTRSIVEQLTEAVIVCDGSGRITNVSGAAQRLAAVQPIGRRLDEAFPIAADHSGASSELRGGSAADAIIAAVMRGRPVHSVEVSLATDEGHGAHFLLSAGPFLDGRGQMVGCIVALTDITPRKRAEEQHRILLAELNHRVKNNLAIVRSVASQTISRSASLDTFQKAFDGRLSALAVAHNILTQTGWQQADLTELVQQVMSPYRGAGEDRVTISGPAIPVPPQFVLPLALVFHELATNAAKYGALSVTAGRVDIGWRSERKAEGTEIRLVWREVGGPAVSLPTREGFGSTLIRRTIAYELEGEAELEYAAQGVVCTITFLLRRNSTRVLEEAVRSASPAA